MKKLVIGILAHVDAGKTTLSESMLFVSGNIRKLGRVDHGDAFLDTFQLERDRGITIFSKQAILKYGDTSITLLDTPGHVDFSVEMERTLQVLDYGILVVSKEGVSGHTKTLWKLLKQYNIPTFIFVNKMDQEGADREWILNNICSQLEGLSQGEFIDFSGEIKEVENMAMTDENAMEEYLQDSVLSLDTIKRLICERRVYPVCFGAALKGEGVTEFLEILDKYTVVSEKGSIGSEQLGAIVFKISRDEQGNRLTHLKVTSGKLRVKDIVNEKEKVNQIRIYSGTKFEVVDEAIKGDVCAVTGLNETYAGMIIGNAKAGIAPILEPVLNYTMILPEGVDTLATYMKIKQLSEEQPELHINWNDKYSEIQVKLMGQIQIEILQSLIKERFDIDVSFGAGHIVYKETISTPAIGIGHFEPLRHYAEVHLLMEPGKRGSGIKVQSAVSEDVLNKNWQKLILSHITEATHPGVLTGSGVTDIVFTLIGGRAHNKHTEGGDFRQATYRAVRNGLMYGESKVLEPYYDFRLEIPTTNLGRALMDMDRMGAKYEPAQISMDMATICGMAPVFCMENYGNEVISYAKGVGHIELNFGGYDTCHNEEEVILQYNYDPLSDANRSPSSVFCAQGAGYIVEWDEVRKHAHVTDYFGIHIPDDCKNYLSRSSKDITDFLENEFDESNKKNKYKNGITSHNKDGETYQNFVAMNKELEEIFVRTYGPQKNLVDRARSGSIFHETYTKSDKKNTKTKIDKYDDYALKEKKKLPKYLLVDGYNVIFAWEELSQLARVNIGAARDKLMDILSNYQGMREGTLILVFDAYKVPGNVGELIKYQNINVVYTKEAETADAYIEKLSHKIGKNNDVTVATSDGLEQIIIRGAGCKLMSSMELYEDVQRVNEHISEKYVLSTSGRTSNVGRDLIKEKIDETLN